MMPLIRLGIRKGPAISYTISPMYRYHLACTSPQAMLPADTETKAKRLPYQTIPVVQKHVAEVLHANFGEEGSQERGDHLVGLLVGAPGSGKSEALRHLVFMAERACRKLLQRFGTVITVLATYNAGNGPGSAEMAITGNPESFKRALALRLLHAALCKPGAVKLVVFAAAVKVACPTACETLEPVGVIGLLRDWLGLPPGERLLVLLGMDEVNKLVSESSQEPLTWLATELGDLGCAGIILPATLVVPFAAGTTAEAGVQAFLGSSHQHKLVNFTPLRSGGGKLRNGVAFKIPLSVELDQGQFKPSEVGNL